MTNSTKMRRWPLMKCLVFTLLLVMAAATMFNGYRISCAESDNVELKVTQHKIIDILLTDVEPRDWSQEMIGRRMGSVVRITDANTVGSGFCISPSLIMTCRHVLEPSALEDPNTVLVEFEDGHVFRATNAVVSEDWDLALISFDPNWYQHEFVDIDVSLDPLTVGQEIYVLGHPINRGWCVTRSSVSKIFSEIQEAKINSVLLPGSSGGPVFSKYGELVGVSGSTLMIDVSPFPIPIFVSVPEFGFMINRKTVNDVIPELLSKLASGQ